MYKLVVLLFFFLIIFLNCSEKITNTENEEKPDKTISQYLFIQNTNGLDDIGIIDSDGQNKNIIISQVDAYNLRFSTDGKKITFDNRNDGNIYMVDSDGNNSTIILENLWGVYDVKLLSNKNIMIIGAYENDGSSSIYYWDISNNNRTKIVDHESNMEDIAVSPNEEHILYISKYDGIYLMDWDGENRREIHDGWCNFPISYSIDGSKLLYCIGDKIYTADSDGENIFTVTNDSIYAEYPSFSPDGTKIVFANNYSGFVVNELCIINIDGTNFKNIYSSPDYRIFSPQYSHDGLKIIFEMNQDIYSVNTDGTELIQLVTDAHHPILKPNSL
jgi:TolB protein